MVAHLPELLTTRNRFLFRAEKLSRLGIHHGHGEESVCCSLARNRLREDPAVKKENTFKKIIKQGRTKVYL